MPRDPNLIPLHVLERRSLRHRMRQWQYVLLLEVCAVAGAVVLLQAQVSDPTVESREAIEGTVAQIDVVSSAAAALKNELQEVQQQLAVATEVVRKPDWSILLSALAWEGKGKVVFDSLQLSGAEKSGAGADQVYRLSIQGNCDTQAELTGFVQSLERTDLFARVKITQTQSLPSPDEEIKPRMGFTIDARIREAR